MNNLEQVNKSLQKLLDEQGDNIKHTKQNLFYYVDSIKFNIDQDSEEYIEHLEYIKDKASVLKSILKLKKKLEKQLSCQHDFEKTGFGWQNYNVFKCTDCGLEITKDW